MQLLTSEDPAQMVLMQALVEVADELEAQRDRALASKIAEEVSKLFK